MNQLTVKLDIRDDMRRGHEPSGRVLQTVSQLEPGQKLLLYSLFEPVSLFRDMDLRGYWHMARTTQTGDWEVLFARRPPGDDRAPERPPPASG